MVESEVPTKVLKKLTPSSFLIHVSNLLDHLSQVAETDGVVRLNVRLVPPIDMKSAKAAVDSDTPAQYKARILTNDPAKDLYYEGLLDVEVLNYFAYCITLDPDMTLRFDVHHNDGENSVRIGVRDKKSFPWSIRVKYPDPKHFVQSILRHSTEWMIETNGTNFYIECYRDVPTSNQILNRVIERAAPVKTSTEDTATEKHEESASSAPDEESVEKAFNNIENRLEELVRNARSYAKNGTTVEPTDYTVAWNKAVDKAREEERKRTPIAVDTLLEQLCAKQGEPLKNVNPIVVTTDVNGYSDAKKQAGAGEGALFVPGVVVEDKASTTHATASAELPDLNDEFTYDADHADSDKSDTK